MNRDDISNSYRLVQFTSKSNKIKCPSVNDVNFFAETGEIDVFFIMPTWKLNIGTKKQLLVSTNGSLHNYHNVSLSSKDDEF